MICSTGEVVFILSDKMDKTFLSTLILASCQGLFLWYIKGNIKSIYPKLALSGGKNECAVTDTAFFTISQVCTRGVTHVLYTFGKKREQFAYNKWKLLLFPGT